MGFASLLSGIEIFTHNGVKLKGVLMENKILLIGPRNLIKDTHITGGVVVLFENLISYCDEHAIQYNIVDTNKANYKNKLIAYIMILFSILINTPKVKQVSLHGTANDYLLIAPFALIISRLFQKTFSLRKFAGNFIEIFEHYSTIKKWIVTYTLKGSSVNFFETKYLVEYFKNYNENTYWFPNVRKKQVLLTNSTYEKNFIFIGAVSREKGIDILCQVSNLLPDDYQIDIYGVLHDHFTIEYFNDYKVKYKGILIVNDVIKTLSEYDILILPSFREGYPGVIIEALSVGLPIVATNLSGIKEMVDEKSSVLVDVGNIEQLKKAMISIDEVNYIQMSIAAHEQFKSFDSDIQTKVFFNQIGL